MISMCKITFLTSLLTYFADAGIIRPHIWSYTPEVVTPDNAFNVEMKVDPWHPERFHFEYETTNEGAKTEYGGFKLSTRGNNDVFVDGQNLHNTLDHKFHPTTQKAYYHNGFYTPLTTTETSKLSNRYPADDLEDSILFPDDYNILEEKKHQDGNTETPQETTTEYTTVSDEDLSTTEYIDIDNRFLPPAVVASLLG